MKIKTAVAALLAFLLAAGKPCAAAESAGWWITGVTSSVVALYCGAHANNDRNDANTASNEAARLRTNQTAVNWQQQAANMDSTAARDRKSAKRYGSLAAVATAVGVVSLSVGAVITVRSNYIGIQKTVRFGGPDRG